MRLRQQQKFQDGTADRANSPRRGKGNRQQSRRKQQAAELTE